MTWRELPVPGLCRSNAGQVRYGVAFWAGAACLDRCGDSGFCISGSDVREVVGALQGSLRSVIVGKFEISLRFWRGFEFGMWQMT